MAASLKLDEDEHPLILGRSFDPNGDTAFHSIRYDFKPYSLNLKDTAKVEIGHGGAVNVKMPRIEGSGPSYAEYSGNKKPCQKECVLIIDNVTGTFTLERLSYNMQVKKKRVGDNGTSNLLLKASPTESHVRGPGEINRRPSPTESQGRPAEVNRRPSPTESQGRSAEVNRMSGPPAKKTKGMDGQAMTAMNSKPPFPLAVQANKTAQNTSLNTSSQSASVVPPRQSQATSLSDGSSSSSSDDDDDDDDDDDNSTSGGEDSADETSPKTSPVTSAAPYVHPVDRPSATREQLFREDLKLSESESD